MALEQDIANLITASNDLTQVVDNKIQAIDKQIAVKEKEVDDFISQQRAKGFTTAIQTDDEGSWERVFSMTHRQPIQITVSTLGGNFGPGSTTFHLVIDWSGNLFVNTISKIGNQYAKKVRTTTDNISAGPSFVEIFIAHRKKQRNPITIDALGHNLPNIKFVNAGVNLPALGKLTPEVVL